MAVRLSSPTKNVFYGSVVLAVLGVIGALVPAIPILSPFSFWILLLGFLLLAAGNTMKGF